MGISFPPPEPGEMFITEGGSETEIMFKHGFELPEFAMFPLLDDPRAVEAMRGMYRAQLDVAVDAGVSVMLTGLDYRASPDWGAKLGYSAEALADATIACIDFLRAIAGEYGSRIPRILIGGIVGPRGDAYGTGGDITAESAEDYHSTQLRTLKRAGVDFASAMTFNNVAEAVGVASAAHRIGVPLQISFTVDGTAKLKSGPTLAEAIRQTDAEAGEAASDHYPLNCSHPVEFAPALDEEGPWVDRLRGFRPNASSMEKIALCKLGHLEEGDPEDLGRLMGDFTSDD